MEPQFGEREGKEVTVYSIGTRAARSVIAHLLSCVIVQVLVLKVADSTRYPKRADALIRAAVLKD